MLISIAFPLLFMKRIFSSGTAYTSSWESPAWVLVMASSLDVHLINVSSRSRSKSFSIEIWGSDWVVYFLITYAFYWSYSAEVSPISLSSWSLVIVFWEGLWWCGSIWIHEWQVLYAREVLLLWGRSLMPSYILSYGLLSGESFIFIFKDSRVPYLESEIGRWID